MGMDRDRTLEAVNGNWRMLREVLDLVPAGRVDEAGVVGSWSVKDLVGHVATWDDEASGALSRYLDDGDATALTTWPDVDDFNAREAERKRDTELSDLLRELKKSHRRLLEVLDRLSDADVGRGDVSGRIRSDTYYHYADHASQIRAWLEASETPGGSV